MLDEQGVVQSEAFKRGMTVEDFIDDHIGTQYEPAGLTPDPDIQTVMCTKMVWLVWLDVVVDG